MDLRMTMMATLLVAVALAGCTDGGAAPHDTTGYSEVGDCTEGTLPAPVHPVAVITTNFGVVRADLHLEQVPVTVQNFIDLAERGDYDGTPFHRIMTDFMMQGGDTTRGDGTGGESADGGDLPDEFHHQLRHSGKGVLSMANAGPNTGSSQFFITFKATTWLDDKHSVFGQVTQGFDVLDAVNADAGSTSGTPKTPVTLESVTIEYEERATVQGFGAGLWVPDPEQDIAKGGGWTRFLVVAESLAPARMPMCISADAPDGVTVRVESDRRTFELPAGQRAAFIVDVEADGPATVPVTLNGPGGELARIGLTITETSAGPAAKEGDSVTGDYIGMTVDGRIFDTSVAHVADAARDDDRGYSTFQHRGTYRPFTFTPGSGVIQGFTDIAVGTPEGLSNAGRVASKDAYGISGQSPLAGRVLLFQLDVLDVS